MSEFPGQGYVPPHIPPQHTPRLQRKRREKPPASLSKLHRPLTRFYCNDCKKKFRSRILANRNNNAVQHYCALYSKIITRKVDSHSNKCKGDHGMGPCVVKRTDTDPDSDGEDETKAAYYADKGKKRPASARRRGAYTKKRKRDEDFVVDDISNSAKRQRRNHNQGPPPPEPMPSHTEFYPPVPNGYDGYYHSNGYVESRDGYPRYYNAPPPIAPPHLNGNGHSTMPPPPEYNEGDIASTPPIPMAISTEHDDSRMMARTEHIPSRIGEDRKYDNVMPPPPALEPIEIENGNGVAINTNDTKGNEDPNDSLFVKVNDNVAVVEKEENKETAQSTDNVERKEDDANHKETEKHAEEENDECINDDNTEEEDDDVPDLTVPQSPSHKQDNPNNASNEQELDFNLDVPE